MNHLTPYPIFERKQVGILYHFTENIYVLNRILSTRKLISTSYPYISFTRYYNLRYRDGEVRLVFNGDRLSDIYSFQPFAFGGVRFEREERIMKDTVAFKDSLVAVDLFDLRIGYQQRLDSCIGKPNEDENVEYHNKRIENFTSSVERLRETYPHIVFNTVDKFTPFRA